MSTICREHFSDMTGVESARLKIKALWQSGDIFHNFSRYPERSDHPKVDRLALILQRGLVPPGSVKDGTIFSDLNIVVTGTETSYNDVVFLHRFGPSSGLYVSSRPGFVTVLVDSSVKVLTRDQMGEHWPCLCLDEVYAKDPIAPEKMIGIVIHESDAPDVLRQFRPDFARLALPVYTIDGLVLWPGK